MLRHGPSSERSVVVQPAQAARMRGLQATFPALPDELHPASRDLPTGDFFQWSTAPCQTLYLAAWAGCAAGVVAGVVAAGAVATGAGCAGLGAGAAWPGLDAF